MAGVVFFFEENDTDVFSGRIVDLDAWRYAIKAGGIDKAVCVNLSDMDVFFDEGFNFTILDSYEKYRKWIKRQSGCVFLETEWSIPKSKKCLKLKDLDHSKVEWYIFGPSNGHTIMDDDIVYIPQNGIGSLHSVHIASVVLLRRWEELNDS